MGFSYVSPRTGRCTICSKSVEGELRHLRLGMDEPAVLVKCACDRMFEPSRLLDCVSRSANLSARLDTRSLQAMTDRWSPVPDPATLDRYPSVAEHEIRMSADLSKVMYDSVLEPPRVTIEAVLPASFAMKGCTQSGRVRIRSEEATTAKFQGRRVPLCPMMTLRSSIEVKVSEDEFRVLLNYELEPSASVSVKNSKTVVHELWIFRATHNPIDDSYAAELEFLSQSPPSDEVLKLAMSWIHTYRGHMESAARVLKESTVQALKFSTPAVLDGMMPREDLCIHRLKADGEPGWLMKFGHVWYLCRLDGGLTVMSWNLVSNPEPYLVCKTVVHVEILLSGVMVYINLLMSNGVPLRPSSSLISTAEAMTAIGQVSGLVYRSEHDTQAGVNDDPMSKLIPSDGVVSVSRLTSATYRIKPATLDLICHRGYLCIQDGKKYVQHFPSLMGMREGRVYECVLEMAGNQMVIKSYSPRPDKRKSNRLDIAEVIISKAQGISRDDLIISRHISDLSFKARSDMYTRAQNLATSGQMVIDIGSGRLQSLQVMLSTACSYVLCDPNLSTFSMPKDVSVEIINDMDPVSIVKVFSKLQSGKLKFASYKGTAESLILQPHVFEYIRDKQVPVVYAFSLSHTMPLFLTLSYSSVPQVAVCYLYDHVGGSGAIIDDSGVYMGIDPSTRYLEAPMAKVKFPGHPEYTELALTSSMIPRRYSCRTLLPMLRSSSGLADRIQSVAESMYIVEP